MEKSVFGFFVSFAGINPRLIPFRIFCFFRRKESVQSHAITRFWILPKKCTPCLAWFGRVLSCLASSRLVSSLCFALFCFLLSHLDLSRLVSSCFVLSCFVLSCPVKFCFVLFGFVSSSLILSCLVLPSVVSFCLILACLISSCFVFHRLVLYLSCLALFFFFLSSSVFSCLGRLACLFFATTRATAAAIPTTICFSANVQCNIA